MRSARNASGGSHSEAQAEAQLFAVFDQYAISKERIARELALLGFSNRLDFITVQSDGHPYVDMTKLDRDKAAAISQVVVEEFHHLPDSLARIGSRWDCERENPRQPLS